MKLEFELYFTQFYSPSYCEMRRKPETNFTTHHVTDKEAPRLTWRGPSSTNSWKGTRVYHRTAMWANGWRPHKCPVIKVWLDQLGPKADKATFALHDMATFRHAEGRILSNIPTERKCIILKVLIFADEKSTSCWGINKGAHRNTESFMSTFFQMSRVSSCFA